MKKNLKKLAALIFIVAMSYPTFGQNYVIPSIDQERSIQIENYSKDETIDIEVFEDTKLLLLEISSTISYGSIKVEIYDPAGKKKGQFSIKSLLTLEKLKKMKRGQKNYMREDVSGKINKIFIQSLVGTWKVKIYPKETHGTIKLIIQQKQQ